MTGAATSGNGDSSPDAGMAAQTGGVDPSWRGGRGPSVVAIGGGHGLAVTLRAAKSYAGELTAVVSVADDGGSSGRLRQELGIPPPGDLRKCLAALASPSSPLLAAMEHRFAGGGLDGHPLGNVLLAGFFQVMGDTQAGIDVTAELLGVEGRVLPATSVAPRLVADSARGTVRGQSAIMATSGIERVYHEPFCPPVSREVVGSISDADQVIIGPGSLYTSVLAAAAVPEIASAISSSGAQRVYVANLRAQAHETEGYDLAAHVASLERHGIEVDVVLGDPSGIDLGTLAHPRVVLADLARSNGLAHDSARLATQLSGLLGYGPA